MNAQKWRNTFLWFWLLAFELFPEWKEKFDLFAVGQEVNHG